MRVALIVMAVLGFFSLCTVGGCLMLGVAAMDETSPTPGSPPAQDPGAARSGNGTVTLKGRCAIAWARTTAWISRAPATAWATPGPRQLRWRSRPAGGRRAVGPASSSASSGESDQREERPSPAAAASGGRVPGGSRSRRRGAAAQHVRGRRQARRATRARVRRGRHHDVPGAAPVRRLALALAAPAHRGFDALVTKAAASRGGRVIALEELTFDSPTLYRAGELEIRASQPLLS